MHGAANTNIQYFEIVYEKFYLNDCTFDIVGGIT